MSNIENQDKTPTDKFKELTQASTDATQAVPERSLWQGGYSPKAMYGTWLLTVIITIAALVGVALFGKEYANIWYIVGGILLVIWILVVGRYVVRRLSEHYELTTQRFIHQKGLLVRRTDRIEVIDIEDVSYTQGIIERMLGVGSIKITGQDESHPELTMAGIDKVPEIASLIDDVRRAERRKRSIHFQNG
jgi:uncharacterized membrane protein YdbT with pleckstrin-like domain